MSYFKLGVNGEGFAFFVPDNYNRDVQVIGNAPRRTINGSLKRDVITTKRIVSLTFSYVTELECATLYAQFEKNINEGKNLTFVDDRGETIIVAWGQQNFGLNDRAQTEDVHWSGTIVLEEV